MTFSEKITAKIASFFEAREQFKGWLLHTGNENTFDGIIKSLNRNLDEAKDFSPEGKLVRALAVRHALVGMENFYNGYFANGDKGGYEAPDKRGEGTTTGAVLFLAGLIGGLTIGAVGGGFLVGAAVFAAGVTGMMVSPSDDAVKKFFGTEKPVEQPRLRLRLDEYETRTMDLDARAAALMNTTIKEHAAEIKASPSYKRIFWGNNFVDLRQDLRNAFANAASPTAASQSLTLSAPKKLVFQP